MYAYMRLWIGMIIPTTWLKWSYLRISHLLTSKSQLSNILENICHPYFSFISPTSFHFRFISSLWERAASSRPRSSTISSLLRSESTTSTSRQPSIPTRTTWSRLLARLCSAWMSLTAPSAETSMPSRATSRSSSSPSAVLTTDSAAT